MADPQVNPAGGATSSWGPENIVTDPNTTPSERLTQGLNQGGVPMIAPDGTKGWVHHSQLQQFQADNPTYKRGMVFTAPDGTPGLVSSEQAGEFQKQNPTYQVGLPKQTAGWNPQQTSRFASAKNFYQSLVNDPGLQAPQTLGESVKRAALGPLAVLPAALRVPQDAAKEVGQYLRAEGESPRAAPIVRNVTSPVGEAASQFVGEQYEPKNLATLAAFSGLPRNTAPLRTLHRVIGGYYAAKGAQGAMQQGDAAQAAFERGDTAEGVRQLTGAGFSGGMAVAGGRDAVENPQQALSDTTATREGLANWLRESGSRDIQRVLGPTTKENKAIAQKVAPEIADRGVMAWTRKGLEQKAGATADEVGQKIDDYYQSLPQGTTMPTQPILDHFEQSKEAFKGSKGEVLDQGAIDRIDALKSVVQQFGSDVPVDDIVKLRRLWDGQVAQAKGFFGKTLAEGSAIDAKREATGAIREELAQEHPDLDKINKEFSFWANVRKVIGDTNARKGSQATPLGEQLYAAAGLAKGGPKGAIALGLLRKVMTSAAWGTVSGATKYKIADFLADGNVTGAAAQLPKSGPPGPGGLPPTILNQPPGGGGAPQNSPVVPPVGPFAQGAQAGLPFQQAAAPPVAGEAPAPAPTRPGTQAPLFRKPWEVAQTPAPAEKVAAAAPETPQAAPQLQPVSPERTAQQDAALQDAAAKIRGGARDKASYDQMREAARVPEMEPEYLRDVKKTRDLRQVDGKYTPEALKAQDADIKAVLGERKPSDPTKKPKVVLMVGGAASGKGGVGVQGMYPGFPTIDSDTFKLGDENLGVKGIPEAKVLMKADPLGAANRMHDESSDISKRAEREAINRSQSFILDKVQGDPEKLRQTIADYKANGYDVDLRGVDKDLNAAMGGMVGRALGTGKNAGRWVPTHVLKDGHVGAARAFHEAIPLLDPATDKWSLHVSNPIGSEQGFEKVADQDRVYNGVRWQEHIDKGNGGPDGGHGLSLHGRGAGGDEEGPRQVRAGESESRSDNRGPQISGSAPGTLSRGSLALQEQDSPVPAPQQGREQQQVEPLHLADSAPPKDKPVMLTYGGAFNPSHDGHVASVQAAHDLLTQAGYNVEGSIVSPTADKLLAKKLGSDDRLSLDTRARIARAQFPEEINGKPVDVHTSPAEEVERNTGKPRRSDLANWGQRQYPNHTIINVTGDDAPVPGAPQSGGPELYQGSPGTAHEGVNYLTVPRIGGHSSTAIREALKSDEPIPGMTPEAERIYREEVAKQQAARSEPVSTARQDQQVEQGARLAGQDGKKTSVFTPSGRELPGKYRVVEGDTLIPSHDPFTFAKNPKYVGGVQERAYHSSKEAQARVIDQEQKFNPRFIFNTDPTGQGGPPVVTPDGTVLGGNSRVMTSQRLYGNGRGDAYKSALIEEAQQFGLDPEQIRGMKNPTLVREIEAPSSVEELRRIGRDLNKPMAGSLGLSERAVSAGKSLKPESLDEVGRMVDQMGEGATLREAMQKHGDDFLHILQRDDVITERERPGMVDKTGGLNEDGKNFVEKALIGSVVEDPDLMERTPKSILNKLGSSLGDVAALAGRSDGYNISTLIRAALREHVQAADKGGPLEDYLSQNKMFGGRNAPVETMARALDGPVKDLRAALRSFATDAKADVAGQAMMPGMLAEKPSPVSAFNHAFGTNFSEPEFDQALRSALEEERHTGKL